MCLNSLNRKPAQIKFEIFEIFRQQNFVEFWNYPLNGLTDCLRRVGVPSVLAGNKTVCRSISFLVQFSGVFSFL